MNKKYYLDKSQTSINDLIQANLDLVKKIAWQLHGRVQNIVEIEDLIQQGMEGLVHAAQKYLPKEGVNFSQYAQLRIRGSIIDYLRKNSNLCRTTIKKKQEFDKKFYELQHKLGREPTKQEITLGLKITNDEFNYWENAFQANNNLLVNDKATINTKPQLEIFADDVKCSHGCTIGQLDENAMFYLRTRGIPTKEAKALLMYAFANNVLESVKIPQLKKRINKLVANKLGVNIGFDL